MPDSGDSAVLKLIEFILLMVNVNLRMVMSSAAMIKNKLTKETRTDAEHRIIRILTENMHRQFIFSENISEFRL